MDASPRNSKSYAAENLKRFEVFFKNLFEFFPVHESGKSEFFISRVHVLYRILTDKNLQQQ